MEQTTHMEHSLGDLLQSSRLKVEASDGLNITTTSRAVDPKADPKVDPSVEIASTGNTPSSTSVPSLSTNLSSESGGSPAFRACSVPKSFAPYQTPPQGAFSQNWSYLEQSDTTDSCLLNLRDHQETILTITPHFTTEDMSTLGIHFDPRFDAGTRPSYTWPGQLPRASPNLLDTETFPVFDMSEQYPSQDGILDPFNMPCNSSAFARSISSSPPTLFTPEQRELKRQRDLARRESKSRVRRDRSSSNNSYNVSQTSTPDLLPRTMSYASGITPSSAPTESTSTFPGHAYLPPLAPHMAGSGSPELFSSSFPLISNDFGGNPYLMPYASPAEQTISSFVSRPHSLSSASDQSYFFRSLGGNPESQDTVRVVHSRPKPQCWDHGCNGRQFSTFSNLLRHQREKSGVASKPTCPKCGAEFTRTTARNGHMAHEKCKQRRNS